MPFDDHTRTKCIGIIQVDVWDVCTQQCTRDNGV